MKQKRQFAIPHRSGDIETQKIAIPRNGKEASIKPSKKENESKPLLTLFIKRLIDLAVAGVLMLLLLPLFLVISFLLKVTAEGEIFYLQERIGYKNKPFNIWKFATMLKNSAKMGTGSITLRNDFRVTPVGKFLRMTKINELPQIINVLKGDMSLVGARPQMSVDFELYSEEVQARIHNTKPGITGIGSVIFRDEEKIYSDSSMDPRECYVKQIAPYKGALEMWYQDNFSVATDIKIMFLTAWVIINPTSNLPYKMFKNLPKKPKFV